jgi:hypothetical protein
VRAAKLQMDEEEPTAASMISHALNHGQEVALRTTELTAVAVLRGAIIVSNAKDLSQRVAWVTVREKVRSELGTTADDPDLPDLFNYLVSAGVGVNTYVEHLLDFGTSYVDSKHRQLRLGVFAIINKIWKECQWVKVSVTERAYRKNPTYGYCPSPEVYWTTVPLERLKKLEELLRFFHSTIKDKLDQMSPQSRIKELSNIDVAVTEIFYVKDTSTPKPSLAKLQDCLLEATVKYLPKLGMDGYTWDPKNPSQWIDFTKFSKKGATDCRRSRGAGRA